MTAWDDFQQRVRRRRRDDRLVNAKQQLMNETRADPRGEAVPTQDVIVLARNRRSSRRRATVAIARWQARVGLAADECFARRACRRAHDAYGDEAQVRDPAVLAARPMNSMRPRA